MRHPVVTEDLAVITEPLRSAPALRESTVLVTGAAGFLPAYIVESLLYLNESAGARVRVLALVRSEAKARARFAHYQGRADLEVIVGDVCEPLAVAGPVDHVIHAASLASPKYFGADPVGTLGANTLGTHRLLELARAKKSRGFLFMSSAEIYGAMAPEQIPTPENAYGPLDPLDVRACYAESKRMGETMCSSWHRQFGVPAKIVRPFHTYGPGMALDDGRVFSDFVADIAAGRDIVMQSDGSAVRAYCYLADATAAFFRVLLSGAEGEAYNVGNSRAEIDVLGLAETLVGLFPERRLRVVRKQLARDAEYVPSKISRVAPDTRKLEALGWAPVHDIASGFARTVQSFSRALAVGG